MALSARKKKALGFGVTGVVFVVAGVVLWVTPSTPDWLGTVLGALGAVANIVGLVVLVPADVS